MRHGASGAAMSLEARAVEALRRERLTLACAESLTGGLLGARITRVIGSSDSFLGGIITYTDAMKASLLGVDRDVLAKQGAVTAEVARQMALGARELLGTDIAISLTGFAGPNIPPGGEVGLVFVGLAHWGGVEVHKLQLPGDRDGVREACVQSALELLLAAIPRAVAGRG